MSTNKKFRVQNGLDVTGEVTVGGVTVINADGTVVSDVSDQLVPLQSDVAALQASVQNIIGTSPETLDTLQEIVAAYEGADSDLQLLIATAVATGTANATAIAANTSSVSVLDAFVGEGNTETPNFQSEILRSDWTAIAAGESNYESSGGMNHSFFETITKTGTHSFRMLNADGGGDLARFDIDTSSLVVGTQYNLEATLVPVDARGYGGSLKIQRKSTGSQVGSVYFPETGGFVNNGGDFTFQSGMENDLEVVYRNDVNSATWDLNDIALREVGATVSALDTTAQTLAEAINELHTEVLTLSGADTSLTDSISANTTAISNEVTRATAAEQANTDAIVVEAAARAAADSDLSASISAISSGVNTGDLTVTGSATFESGINVGSNGGSIGYDDTSEDIQMMSDVDMSGNLIHNLGAPVSATDAASKSYVDGRISAVIGGSVESLDTIKEVVDAFEGADSDLQSLITANSTSVSANTTAIAAETTRAQGVEASLQSQITAAADTSGLEADIQANETAIATLDAFVGEGNTEAPNYLPAIASNGSSYLGNVGPSATLTGVGTHGVNIVQSNNSSFSAAGSYTLSGLTAGTEYRFDVDVTAVNAGNGLGADGINLYINDGSSNSVGGPTTLEMLGVSKFGGPEHQYFTPTSDTVTIVFYAQNTNCEWTIENMSITIEGDSPVALDTTAQTVAGAVNELAAAVADTSSITAAFQAADSDVTAAFTAADAAITTAFQAADASLQAQISAGSFDGSAIDQNLVPSVTDTYSLGTADKVWKDLYIGPGSLYLNGTKILEDDSGTITMNADAGQNLSFGATGGGSIDLNAGTESIQMKSDMVMSVGKTITTVGGAATKFGGPVDMQASKIENLGVPTSDTDAATKSYVDTAVSSSTVSGDRTFDANVIVEGNLTVSGTTTTVNSETISLADNIIDLNSNLTSGTPSEHAGIRVLRGDESAVQVRWNETSDHWEVYNGSTWTKIALDTDDLAEGSTNLYFTDARARGCVSADDHSCIDYDETTGKFSLDVAETEAAITPDSAKDADKLDGQHGSFYRINVYDANGTLVN